MVLKVLSEGTLKTNGQEQILVEFAGRNYAVTVVGYVDLSNMESGDIITIREYLKITEGGDYKKYAEQTYEGVQDNPIVYITSKEAKYGLKVTLQQTAGSYKSFPFQFFYEYEKYESIADMIEQT